MNEREKFEGSRVAVTANTVTGYIHVRERNSRKDFGPFDKVNQIIYEFLLSIYLFILMPM